MGKKSNCGYCSRVKPKSDWDEKVRGIKFQNFSLANKFEAIIEGNKIIVDYEAYSTDSSFDEEIEIKFCPMCGKALTPTNNTI